MTDTIAAFAGGVAGAVIGFVVAHYVLLRIKAAADKSGAAELGE